MKTQRTRSQEVIFKLLTQLNRSISAQELYVELRQRQQNVGLATIYRALEALKVQGVVKSRTLVSGEAVYSCVQKDQHHLTCVNCGASIPINECPVHDLEHRLEKSHHFKVYYHTLEFFGLCQQCSSANPST
jgi:Fur family ferric uptake transcriptional regulator